MEEYLYSDLSLSDIYNQLSKAYKTAAWQRTEGQNPKGGLNAKGRASARAEGHNLKPPVKSGYNPRRASFLARMGNSPGPEYDEHGKPTRLLLSLQAWGASSKADAKRKAKAISARLKMRKSMNVLEKGRGEDARTLFNNRSADQYDEKHYPTGKMIQGRSERAGLGAGYRGVFGENRHLLVEASSKIPRKTKNPSEWYAEPADMQQRLAPSIDPHIEWVHIKPGTVVEPHHIQQVFHALYDAGFTGPNLTYTAIPDPDEVYHREEPYHPDPDVGYHPDQVTSVRHSRKLRSEFRRDRLFRPWAEKWKEFVASQPPAPYIDTTQPAGEREDEDPWEGMKEFHEPEVDLQQELEKYSEERGIRAGYGQTLRRSWFSVSIRRFE